MTTLDEYITQVKTWTNRFDHSDPLITSFVRIAEGEISDSIRIADNTVTMTVPVVNGLAVLPDDFEEFQNLYTSSGHPIRLAEPDFYLRAQLDSPSKVARSFWWTGTELHVGGGKLDGTDITLVYFARVPELDENTNWLITKYYQLILAYTLAASATYELDEERARMYTATGIAKIEQLNSKYILSRSSGSRINIKARPF